MRNGKIKERKKKEKKEKKKEKKIQNQKEIQINPDKSR